MKKHKIKKIKQVKSKIKEIESTEKNSELEENIAQEELDDFAEFIQGVTDSPGAGTIEEITPVLQQEDISEIADTTGTEARGVSQETAISTRSYENSVAGYSSSNSGTARTYNPYNPTIRAETAAGSNVQTPLLPQDIIAERGVPGKRLVPEGALSKPLESDRSQQYESAQRGEGRKPRRGAQEGG